MSSKHLINTTIAIEGKLETHKCEKHCRGVGRKDWWKSGVYKATKSNVVGGVVGNKTRSDRGKRVERHRDTMTGETCGTGRSEKE